MRNRTEARTQASQSWRHEQVPRKLPHRALDGNRFPPRPCVEEEAVSLAKEYIRDSQGLTAEPTDEDPKHRGDVDQTPVILPVHEHNPERRFVLVPNSADDDKTEDGLDTQPQYDVNTCKRFVLVHPDEAASDSQVKAGEMNPKEEDNLPGSSARSHKDLPGIKTNLGEAHAQPPSASNTADKRRLRRASVTVDQKPTSSSEYSDRRYDSKTADGLLSPVTQHSTNGRDRSYWDYSSGTSTTAPLRRSHSGRERKDPRAVSDDRHSAHGSRSQTTEREDRYAYHGERHRGGPTFGRTAVSPPQLSKRESPPSQRGERRKIPSPPRTSASKEALPTRTLSPRRRHHQSSRDEDDYAGSDHGQGQRSDPRATRSRGLGVGHADRVAHVVPERPVEQRQRPRASSPLAPSRLAMRGQSSDSDRGHGPRSATVPTDGHQDAPYPTNDRAPFKPDSFHVEMPVPIPMPTANPVSSGISSPPDRHRSPIAPPSQHRQGSTSLVSSRPDKAVTSFRRYSEDVRQGLLPSLPDCARIVPRAGYSDWLTIPRTENFDICPGCYGAVFANSPFQHAFVPALRSRDKPIGCDFGTPPWYRIAYLMTLKYGYTDLRLLQAIAAVAARHQPCAGQRSATRIWHGLLDPANKRPIADFPVCHGCARTVEVLLPNLAGAFAPLDSASEPSKGMCELRFAPDRKRFLDYFDLLETASDRGLSRKAAPDLQHLADRVREISLVNECHRARPVPGRKWYVMKALPEFTVCEECFDEAVWPWQEGTAGGGGADDAGSQTDGLGGGTGSAIAWNFLPRMQQRQMAACQLYSERMRLAFRDACQRNDLGHLANVVRDRIQREEWMRARLTKLQREPPDDPRVQEEIARVVREWKLVE